ncbi:MAG: hypothetical protein ACREDR_37595 [Blastocatellia bacterium]
MDAKEVYDRYVSKLSPKDRQRLLDLISENLPNEPGPAAHRSLLELEGVGAEIWSGIDAQQYVDDLRKEWDQRL